VLAFWGHSFALMTDGVESLSDVLSGIGVYYGLKIALRPAEGGGPNYSIYVRKTDGSPAVRVGDSDAFSISADGKWVLATTNAGGGSLVLLPTGAGEPRPLKTGNLQDPIARFLPDGNAS
jgi:hypothetical protein